MLLSECRVNWGIVILKNAIIMCHLVPLRTVWVGDEEHLGQCISSWLLVGLLFSWRVWMIEKSFFCWNVYSSLQRHLQQIIVEDIFYYVFRYLQAIRGLKLQREYEDPRNNELYSTLQKIWSQLMEDRDYLRSHIYGRPCRSTSHFWRWFYKVLNY